MALSSRAVADQPVVLAVLLATLQAKRSWLQGLLVDIQRMAGCTTSEPFLEHVRDAASLVRIFRASDKTKMKSKLVKLSSDPQLQLLASWGHYTRSKSSNDDGLSSVSINGNREVQSESGFKCNLCDYVAKAIKQLRGHAFHKHSLPSPIAEYINFTVCPSCLIDFGDHQRILQHLRPRADGPGAISCHYYVDDCLCKVSKGVQEAAGAAGLEACRAKRLIGRRGNEATKAARRAYGPFPTSSIVHLPSKERRANVKLNQQRVRGEVVNCGVASCAAVVASAVSGGVGGSSNAQEGHSVGALGVVVGLGAGQNDLFPFTSCPSPEK